MPAKDATLIKPVAIDHEVLGVDVEHMGAELARMNAPWSIICQTRCEGS